MTATLDRPIQSPSSGGDTDPSRAYLDAPTRLAAWLTARWQGAALLVLLLVPIGWITGSNFTGYPARFEDEGTYVSQAWAMLKLGSIANYTYWYDHPFIGWAQLAGWLGLTDGLDRYDSAITAAREFAWVANLVACALLYLLARRLGMRKIFAALGVVLFAFSPLALVFHRYMLLDNLATPWLLAAFVLALTPRQHVAAIVGSAACMAVAVLSKETALIVVPVLVYMIWQHGDVRNRRYKLAVFVSLFAMFFCSYPLYAAIKSELLPGPGHVSLVGAVDWQLFIRESSGSLFDTTSGAYGLAGLWLGLDYWLLGLGSALTLVAVFKRRLRPVSLALLIQLLMLLRNGYLPYAYVITMLPFAALMVAGVADWTWGPSGPSRLELRFWRSWHGHWSTWLRRFVCVACIVALAMTVTPVWQTKVQDYMTQDDDAASRATVAWVEQHVPRNDLVVVDSSIWLDLVDHGYDHSRVIWVEKINTDQEVDAKLDGWNNIQYIAVSAATFDAGNAPTHPTIFTAQQHSRQVATFGFGPGRMVILEVNDKG